MAVEVIKNQLISIIENDETFNERNARQMWDTREYCQLVKSDQTTEFQLRLTEASGNNLVANGDFTTNLNGWGYFPATWFQLGGTAYVNLSPVYFYFYQDIPLEGKTYLLTWEAAFVNTVVSSNPNMTLEVSWTDASIIGGTSLITSAELAIDSVANLQSFSTYFRGNVTGLRRLTFKAKGSLANDFVFIDNVRLVELSEPIVTLETCTGDFVRDVNTFTRFENYITVSHDWDGLVDEGCYRFCIYGTEDISLNYLGIGTCIVDERHRPLVTSEGGCIKYYG